MVEEEAVAPPEGNLAHQSWFPALWHPLEDPDDRDPRKASPADLNISS